MNFNHSGGSLFDDFIRYAPINVTAATPNVTAMTELNPALLPFRSLEANMMLPNPDAMPVMRE